MLSSRRRMLFGLIAVSGMTALTGAAYAGDRASEIIGPIVATTLLATQDADVHFVHRRHSRHRHGYRGYRYRPYGYRHHRRYRTYWYHDGYRYRSYRRYY